MTTDTKPIPIISETGGYAGSRSALPDEVKAEVLVLVEQGLSRAEVGRRLGSHASTVSRIAAANGLGLNETKTERATHARIVRLRERRVDAAEQTHLAYEQAVALAQARMITRPDDARGIAESCKAIQAVAQAYESLARIDARSLADFATEYATERLDAAFVGFGIREPGHGGTEKTSLVDGAVDPEPDWPGPIGEGADHE